MSDNRVANQTSALRRAVFRVAALTPILLPDCPNRTLSW